MICPKGSYDSEYCLPKPNNRKCVKSEVINGDWKLRNKKLEVFLTRQMRNREKMSVNVKSEMSLKCAK